MKINKAKLLVGTLAIAAVAATAGSISGTIAWYQYSTRVTAAYVGTSAKCSEKLLIKVGDGDYKTDLSAGDIQTYLNTTAHTGGTFTPITTGAMGSLGATDALDLEHKPFKAHPIYQYFAYDKWEDAKATDYVVIPLTVKLVDVDQDFTSDPQNVLAGKSVWLQDIVIAANGTDSEIYKAVRVHLSASNGTDTSNHLLASAAGSTTQNGKLDLNGDSVSDNAPAYNYGTSGTNVYTEANAVKYGGDDAITQTYVAGASLKATDSNGALTGGTALGTTNDDGELAITATIWLEGWHQLGTPTPSSIWDTSLIGMKFQIGMTFAVSALA